MGKLSVSNIVVLMLSLLDLSIDAALVCGGTSTEKFGTILSPNYPLEYEHNLDCVYIIDLSGQVGSCEDPNDVQIQIDFQDFSTEVNYDQVTYGTGTDSTDAASYIALLEGTTNPGQILVDSPSMWFKFVTDGTILNTGFSLTWTYLSPQDSCNAGWFGFGDHCYYVDTGDWTYAEAQAACLAMGADLPSIHSDAEYAILAGFARAANKDVWLGLNDISNEGVYALYADGTPLDITFWGAGEPNDGGAGIENCVQLWQTIGFLWNDVNCDETMAYVCKREKEEFSFVDEQYFVLEGNALTIGMVRTAGGLPEVLNADADPNSGNSNNLNGINDWTAVDLMFFDFAPGARYSTTSLVANEDGIPYEGIECFTLYLDAPGSTIERVGEICNTNLCIIDQTTWYYIEEAEYVVGERAGTLTVRIRRGGYQHDPDARVGIEIEEGTADDTADYTDPASLAASFTPGQNYVEMTFGIMADNLLEITEYLLLKLINPIGGVVDRPNAAMIYIRDETAVFSFDSSQYVSFEGQALALTIVRSKHLNQLDYIHMTANTGSATTSDYPLVNRFITFSPGDTFQTETLVIEEDILLEDWETFSVSLTTRSSTADTGAVVAPGIATVFIKDTTATFWLDSSQYFAEECTDIEVTIRRFGYLERPDSLSFASAAGTASAVDYSLGSTNVDFNAGDTFQTATITIEPDALVEDYETFTISITTNNPTRDTGVVIAPSTATVFIRDATAVFWIESSQYTSMEGGVLVVTLRRDGFLGRAEDLTVTTAADTASAGEFVLSSTAVSFTEGETSQTATVMITADADVEDCETFIISLTANNPTDEKGVVIAPSTATVFIKDTTASFWFESSRYIAEEGESFDVVIRRDGYLGRNDDLTLATNPVTADPGEFTLIDTMINFAPGDTSQTATFTIEEDAVIEDWETFTISLTPDDPTDHTSVVIGANSAMVFMKDTTAVFWIESSQYIAEEGVNLNVAIHREGYLRRDDELILSTADGTAERDSDYSVPDVSISFAAGTTEITKIILVPYDTIIEDLETFLITVTPDDTTDDTGIVVSPNPALVYIQDTTAYFWIEEKQYIATEGKDRELIINRGGVIGRLDMLTLECADGRALILIDYMLPVDDTIMFEVGDTETNTTLTILHDNILEHWEDFAASITINPVSSTAASGTLTSPSSSEILIKDTTWYVMGCATFTVWEYEASFNITVKRQGDISQPGYVYLSTNNLTAKSGDDFMNITDLMVEFETMASEVLIDITILTDDLVEPMEQLEVVLDEPSKGEALGELFKSVVHVYDDDAWYAFEKPVYHFLEHNGAKDISVNVLRIGYIEADGTVEISSHDRSALAGSDFAKIENHVVQFEVGEDAKSIDIHLLGDLIVEENEWFEICLTNPIQGELSSPRCASIQVEDDDSLISFGDETYAIQENVGQVEITVVRSGSLRTHASIEVETLDGSAEGRTDFTRLTRSIVFAVRERSYTFPIPIVDDNIVESTETFQMRLSNVKGGEIGAPNVADIFIENDDVSYWFANSKYSVSEHERHVFVTVMRTGYMGQRTSVELSTKDGTAISTHNSTRRDYEGVNREVLTFLRDQTSYSVKLDIVDDPNYELMENFQVELVSNILEELAVPRTALVNIISDDAECFRECMNGGVCINPDECQCPRGFTGNRCQFDVDECQLLYADVCTNENLVCKNTYGSYYCECGDPNHYLIGQTCVATSVTNGRFAFVEFDGEHVDFKNEMLDTTSDVFLYWASILEDILESVFRGLEGFLTVKVTALYQGSIGVKYDIITDNKYVTTVDELQELFKVNVHADLYMEDTSLKLVNGSIYFEGCPSGYCQNGGHCVFKQTSDEYTCICDEGFSGPQCEIIHHTTEASSFPSDVITMITIGLVILIVVLLLILVCVCLLYWKKAIDAKIAMQNGNGNQNSNDVRLQEGVSGLQGIESTGIPARRGHAIVGYEEHQPYYQEEAFYRDTPLTDNRPVSTSERPDIRYSHYHHQGGERTSIYPGQEPSYEMKELEEYQHFKEGHDNAEDEPVGEIRRQVHRRLNGSSYFPDGDSRGSRSSLNL